jgi:hypothetical protein
VQGDPTYAPGSPGLLKPNDLTKKYARLPGNRVVAIHPAIAEIRIPAGLAEIRRASLKFGYQGAGVHRAAVFADDRGGHARHKTNHPVTA